MFALAWRRQPNPRGHRLCRLRSTPIGGHQHGACLLFFQEELKGFAGMGKRFLAQNSWSGVSLLPLAAGSRCAGRGAGAPLACWSWMMPAPAAQHLSQASAFLPAGLAVFVTARVVSVVGLIGFIGLAAPA